MYAIRLHDLVTGYGRTKVLKGISLNVEEGSILGYLGPNGAGKTTTILTILGILKPWRGKVEVFGYDVVKYPKIVKKMTLVAHQELAGDPFLTVEENILFYLRLRGMPKNDAVKKTEEVLELFNLSEHRRKMFIHLSPGLAKRVQVAKCFAAVTDRTRLMILDEPTAGTDPRFKLRLWGELQRLRDNGVTIMLTTNIMEDVERICDKVAFINAGKIIFYGSVPELKRRFRIEHLYRIKCRNTEILEELAEKHGFRVIGRRGENIYIETNDTYSIPELSRILSGCGLEGIEIAGKDLNEIFAELVGGVYGK